MFAKVFKHSWVLFLLPLIHSQFHFIHADNVFAVEVAVVCFFDKGRRCEIDPPEDGDGTAAVGQSSVNLVGGEGDAGFLDVGSKLVVEDVGILLLREIELVPLPVVSPVPVADSDGNAPIGEMIGIVGMQADIAVNNLVGTEQGGQLFLRFLL